MKSSNSTNSQSSLDSAATQDLGFSPWQRLKSKRISYLTLPLIVMATVVEFVILATGWKYQQVVCLPQGMGVVFFGIGPIGATILAVELLKLPLAIWTASRQGWQKGFMLIVGLPLICVLTFQLVKDMAVYEMGVAMTPASQALEKAAAEEIRIGQLNGELAAIEGKKTERERKLAELTAKRNKAKNDLDDSLKRNDESRQDAISLTDFQKKELSEVEARQATIIAQFNADTAAINKEIADLHARREIELGRASKWNLEEARIENAYKAKLADYTNRKAAFEKAKAEYDNANFLKRQLMTEPVNPGVPPGREVNAILKPTAVAEIDQQIKTKEAELTAVNNKRRDRVAQVDADARRLREEFDKRSTDKRAKTDSKREELVAAQTKVLEELNAAEKQVDQEVAAAVQKVDGIRAEIDAARKTADGFYEAREASIRKTQVHRIATTVEIVRGWLFGEHPLSITATARERGDRLTDQISMVRIWVYPVLAFIVAFLPTLMVEIGFSTVFKPEQQRPAYRLGFFGRRLHWLYTRAGRLKILRAERMANEASGEIAVRDRALAAAQAEVQTAQEAVATATAAHEEQLKQKEGEWVAKFTDLADSLNKAVIEKDALRDLQKSEIERQIQMRQNAWSDRLTQLRQELDDQRAAAEAERTTLIQDHHKKLMDVTEECKTQVIEARRQMADAELTSVEKSAKLASDLREALNARDTAETQLKHQAESLSRQLSQAQEDACREVEKAVRQEKHRLDQQQSQFEKVLRQRDEDFEHRLKQREQELAAKAAARETELQNQWASDLRGREQQWEQQAEARARAAETRLGHDALQKEEMFQIKLRQREQQLQSQFDARQTELKAQWDQELRNCEQEWQRKAEAGTRAAEARMTTEMQQKEELLQSKLRQRDQQWQARLETARVEWQSQAELELRQRDAELTEARQREQDLAAQLSVQSESHQMAEKEWQTELEITRGAIGPVQTLLARTEKERDEARQSALERVQQVQDLEKKLMDASSLLTGWKNGKSSTGGRMGRNSFKATRDGLGISDEV